LVKSWAWETTRSIDALIRAKEAMGRQRNREAALQLRAIRERLSG
jgi:hypothetical protein